VYGEGFGISERLHGDIELGMGAEVAASMAEVGALEESGVW